MKRYWNLFLLKKHLSIQFLPHKWGRNNYTLQTKKINIPFFLKGVKMPIKECHDLKRERERERERERGREVLGAVSFLLKNYLNA